MKRMFLRLNNLLAKWSGNLLASLFKGKKIVLVFHEIRNDIKKDESCKIRTSTFKTIIDREGELYQYVSVDNLLSDDKESMMAVVSFDDVPHSFLENAYPILKEKNIPFVLFVSGKFVGNDGFLSEEEIIALDKDPLCTIGAHTMNHIKLRDNINGYDEILNSKKYLESLLGHKVKYFAYPYGRYDSVSKKNRKSVEVSGFFAAFSTIQSPVHPFCNRFFIPRLELIK